MSNEYSLLDTDSVWQEFNKQLDQMIFMSSPEFSFKEFERRWPGDLAKSMEERQS